jgi:predicted SnoaL-like aldol condensation-catalyzing enzyme
MKMKFIRITILTFTLLGGFLFIHMLQADQAAEKGAITASVVWLSLVDQGKYLESWDQASELFKAAVTKEQWQSSLKAVRPPLGKMLERKLKSKQYTKTLPGAPDGEYVVIQYETSFEKKKSAIETVTPMLDKDGKWKVSGYYIK